MVLRNSAGSLSIGDSAAASVVLVSNIWLLVLLVLVCLVSAILVSVASISVNDSSAGVRSDASAVYILYQLDVSTLTSSVVFSWKRVIN